MLDDEGGTTPTTGPTTGPTTSSTEPTDVTPSGGTGEGAATTPPRRRRTTKKTAAADPAAESAETPAKAPAAKRTRKKAAATAQPDAEAATGERPAAHAVLFQAPETPAKAAGKRTATAKATAKTTAAKKTTGAKKTSAAKKAAASDAGTPDEAGTGPAADGAGESADGADRPAARRRRGRRGRGGKGTAGDAAIAEADESTDAAEGIGDTEETPEEAQAAADAGLDEDAEGAARRRRRRRRRRKGDSDGEGGETDDGVETVVHVREPRPAAKRTAKATDDDDGVRGVKGSTRLEAKRQRRRDGRDTGRRRPSIITEAEFLARRESVERVMVVRQTEERTQIGVLEDGVLVEHYVARKDQTSMVGNVYLGKVQNVLPSMEAAFVDIGRGRNAVLYAGEVNYDASAIEGRPPRIEQALKSGQAVLVQVTKDPIGHKGGRLTSQISLPGRYMVYVPDGRLSGISRKLPDTERTRLKGILKKLTPEDAGVIIRTAAEGAAEEDLERDLKRLHAQWEDIQKKTETASAPSLIYGEPDVVIRVIRDIFNEDFKELVVSGDEEWETVDNYVRWVAPDLAERTRKWTESQDVFAAFRIDEQLAKALDRKVWLPSGGYLVIDRTEAMIVIDVNTGKFTGKGGNLEETVTKNNIEAAEEIVRQLRLRDLGGIIVIDFIDMVLESNRDLVLRRLLECLGRDRTRHQVAEVTSLGLVQMTRKRVGQGLLETYSEPCKECAGRGVKVTFDPVADRRPAGTGPAIATPESKDAKPGRPKADKDGEAKPKKRSRGGRGKAKSESADKPAETTASVAG